MVRGGCRTGNGIKARASLGVMTDTAPAAADLERAVRSALRRRLQLTRTEGHPQWDDECVVAILAAAGVYAAKESLAAVAAAVSVPAPDNGTVAGEPREPNRGGQERPEPDRPARQPSRRGGKAAAS